MKRSAIIFLLILSGLLHAQSSDMSSIENLEDSDMEFLNASNTAYLKANHHESKRIAILQEKVAILKIDTLEVYRPKSSSTYDVSFSEGKNKISARYDKKGTILSTKETYINVPLPSKLSRPLGQKYPGWEIFNTTCMIEYQLGKTLTTYKITLKKNDLNKSVFLRL